MRIGEADQIGSGSVAGLSGKGLRGFGMGVTPLAKTVPFHLLSLTPVSLNVTMHSRESMRQPTDRRRTVDAGMYKTS